MSYQADKGLLVPDKVKGGKSWVNLSSVPIAADTLFLLYSDSTDLSSRASSNLEIRVTNSRLHPLPRILFSFKDSKVGTHPKSDL